ncbi:MULTISPECIES: hypothetical protein [unclassified Peribacillus]|uniref:hypothetical protein n=2 Tax=Peribacillus TaxID=2675229 RepID=UPI001913D2BA|nr:MULTISPECIES: hypothetical protein [unclassified Peribacillus]MBK5497383.1 hypothetical protein [Peribacillus sp. TH14]WMX57475.1 hypothetical protein RE409_09770 [Peribacillus sp. R9-11]
MKLVMKSFVFALFFLLIVPQVSLGYSEEDVEEDLELGESIMVEGELSGPGYGTKAVDRVVKTLEGPTKVKKRVRYLTGSWVKASSYQWSKSNSATSTVSSDAGASAGGISSSLGVSNSVTTTYSVAITIPADKKKFSKLAFYSDFNKRYVRVLLYNFNGILYSDKKTNHYAPRKDTYLQVVYQ